MTLNITLVSKRAIYQCADYRITSFESGETEDYRTQKIVYFSGRGWSASVCFAGVGHTAVVDTYRWLSAIGSRVSEPLTLDLLLGELLKADAWLSTVPLKWRRHSFTVGAFVGVNPEFALVSNFEEPLGPARPTADERLTLFRTVPGRAKAYVSGDREALPRSLRRRLEELVAIDPPAEQVFEALAEANRFAARRSRFVSPACFTTHLRDSGGGGGRPHGTGAQALPSPMAGGFGVPGADALTELLQRQFGKGGGRLVQFAVGRSEPTEEHHRVQLRDNPTSPDAHSNYGAFLFDVKKDAAAAERSYRRAIDLDPNHANANGNLANLLSEWGDKDGAATHYRRAIESGNPSGTENAAWNFANFLVREFGDREGAVEALKKGLTATPTSARASMLLVELFLELRRPEDAAKELERARENGAEPARLEAAQATLLSLMDAPVGIQVEAYRRAISLNPSSANLRLNLAQLLLLRGDPAGNAELGAALRLGLEPSAELEAQVYYLCHTDSPTATIEQRVRALVAQGGRLHWNITENVAQLDARNPARAQEARRIIEAML